MRRGTKLMLSRVLTSAVELHAKCQTSLTAFVLLNACQQQS